MIFSFPKTLPIGSGCAGITMFTHCCVSDGHRLTTNACRDFDTLTGLEQGVIYGG